MSKGHLLIIPKRHFADYFEATREEKIAILDAIERVLSKVELDPLCDLTTSITFMVVNNVLI